MAKKSRLDKILEERKKQQKANTTGNTRTISTGLPSTRQSIAMPRNTVTEVQVLAQSLFKGNSNLTQQQQNRVNSVVGNYQSIKNNGMVQNDNIKKAISNYNTNFRETGVISKDSLNKEGFLDKVKKQTDPKTQQKMLQQYNSLFDDNKSTLQVRKEAKDEETVNKINNGTTAEKVFNTAKFLGQGMLEGAVGTLGQINATAQNISRNTNYNKVQKMNEFASSYQQNLQNIDNKLIQFGGQVTNTVGGMLPSIGMNLIAPGTGTIMAGVSAGSSAYLETLNESQDNKGKAMLTGILKGTLAGTIEKIIGGNKIGTGALDDIAVKGIAKVKSQLAQKLLSKGYEVVGEVGEENLENLAGYLVDMAINNKKVTVEDVVRDLIDTTGTTAGATLLLSALGLGGSTFNDVQIESNKNNQIKNSGLTQNQQQKLTEVAEKYNLSQADIQNLIDNTKNGKYDQNQTTTIENKPVLQQGQQTIQTEGKIDKKTISQQPLGNDKYSIKMPNSNFKFEKTGNENEDKLDESMSTYFNNSEDTKKFNKTLKTIMKDKGISIVFDANVTDANGNVVDGKYENGVMTINPNSERAFEYIATHELTHAIGTKQMIDMVQRFRESNVEFDNKVKTLLDNYTEGEITEEALADVSAQLFGTQEFINNVKTTNPNLFQRIYNEIKYLWHQFRGYKNQNQFVEDLYNKWTQAYNSNAELNQTEKYLFGGRTGVENAIKEDSRYITMKNALDEAKTLQGKYSNEEIRQKTGWFEDKNGDWKFEFSDKDISLKPQKYVIGKEYKLGDVLQHDILFMYYPELKKYNIKFDNIDSKGVFHENSKLIVLNKNRLNKTSELYGTAIHELQHAIQHIEGFETGTTNKLSKLAYLKSLGENEARDSKQRYLKEIEDKNYRKNTRPVSSIKDYENPQIESYLKERGRFDKFKDDLYNSLDKLFNKFGGQEYDTEIIKEDKIQNNSMVVGRRRLESQMNEELEEPSSFNLQKNKEKQLEIILKNNPMQDDYHVGIRTVEDIKTFEEAMQDDESFVYGDFSKEDAEKALERGIVTVYSSKPIENGGFVSTSRNMAKDYAGSGKIYSKEVPLTDVAWINGDEGQYAKVDNAKYLISTDAKRNIEQKIDRYSRIVERMQKEGRNSDEWAPYANEILRLEDALETGYLKQGNNEWQEYLESNFKAEGTRTYGKDIRAEQTKKISEVFKKNVLLENTTNLKRYTGKKQINNEIAKILETPKEKQKPEDRKWAILKANLLDKGIVFEDLSKKAKNRELESKWDYTLSSGARAQYAIGNARYEEVNGKRTKVSKGLTEIIDEVGDKVNDFQNYMYHQLNIDRMSLEKNAKAEMERMKANELFNYDDVVIRNLARKRITDKLTPERKQLIQDAKQYVALSEVQNKPVFGKGVTEFHSKNKVAEFEKNNPQFKDWAKDVYNYLKADKMELVKNGVISQELSNKFEQLYPHYVPIQRVDKNGNAIAVPLDTRRTGINTPIKEAKGGNSDISPLFQTMANRTMQTYRASARNSLGLELRKTLQQLNNYTGTDTKASLDNIIDSMENEAENNTLLQASSNGRLPTFTVFENGNKVTFDISEDIYDALKPKDSSSLTSRTFKLPNAISNIRRGVLTEYNPIFSITNTLKDTQDVLLNSQHPLKTYKKYPEAYRQIIQKGYWYEEYMQNGGEQNSYFTEGDFVQDEESKVKSAIKIPFEKISQVNGVMEIAPRLAEYIASRESGRSIQTSMLDASRVTTNFKAGGDVTKFLNRNGATFLNAGVQGTMQFVRNIREAHTQGLKGYAMLASKMTVAGLPLLILNNLVWDDDDEYEQLQDYVKDSYYIVGKTKDGNFIRIPKGRGLAVIQKIVGNVNKYLNNKEELNIDNVSADFWESLKFAFDNIAPNNPIENNVLSPIFQVANNTSWYGDDIVPERLQSVPAEEQYDETTDAFSIWLGDKLKVSPMKINYLLDQYGGGVADILLPMGTKQAENTVMEDKFTTNPIMKSKYPGEFFEKSDEIEVQSNSINATDADIIKGKYMTDISGEMSDLYKEKRKIQGSDDTDESKKKQLEEVQAKINDLAKTGIEQVDNAKIDGYVAEVGDRLYYKDDEGEWKKIDKEKDLVKGLSTKTYANYKNKVSKATDKKRKEKNNKNASLNDSEKSQILLDSNYTEKEKRLMYPKYIGSDDKLYEHLSKLTGDKVSIDQYLDYKTKGDELKADDNPNSNIVGKTISGSKKKKVVNYLNTSDFSDIEKLYIYGTQYSFDSKQKTQFQGYIEKAKKQGRITSSEATEIYKKLNSVEELEDGRIRWK